MTLLTTKPSQQAIQRIEHLIDRLKTKLENLFAQPIWDELEIEAVADALSSWTYIGDPSDDYYNLEHYLRACRAPLNWTEDEVESGYALTPEAWTNEQRQGFAREYRSFGPNPFLPQDWKLHRLKDYPDGPLEGQELIDLLNEELGGCHNPPGCLKMIGKKRALEKRYELEMYLFDAGYIANQVLLQGTEEDYLSCFFKMKAADKAAREQVLIP